MPEIEIHETAPVLESVEKPDSPLTIYFRDDLKIPSFIQLFALRKEVCPKHHRSLLDYFLTSRFTFVQKDRRQAENSEALTSPQDRTFVKPNQADFVKKGKAAMKDIHKLTNIIPDSGEFRFLDLGCANDLLHRVAYITRYSFVVYLDAHQGVSAPLSSLGIHTLQVSVYQLAKPKVDIL